MSRIRVVTATEDTRDTGAGAIPHPDRSVPDAHVSPRVENWLSQYRDACTRCRIAMLLALKILNHFGTFAVMLCPVRFHCCVK